MRRITLDIETEGVFQNNGDFSNLEVTVVGVYDSHTKEYSSYLKDELHKLWPLIESADMLVRFDYRVDGGRERVRTDFNGGFGYGGFGSFGTFGRFNRGYAFGVHEGREFLEQPLWIKGAIVVAVEGALIGVRLIDAQFPPYAQVIPDRKSVV